MNFRKLSDSAINIGQIVTIGSDANHVAVCGALDIPAGLALTTAAGAEDPLTIATFDGAGIMIASGAILAGAWVEVDAAGKVQTLGAGSGVHQVVGLAISHASANNDPVTVEMGHFIREI